MKRIITCVMGAVAVALLGAGTAQAGPGSTVLDWGSYTGIGTVNKSIGNLPQAVTVPGTVKQIATSNSDSYALTTGGTVWAWGGGSAGELGNGGNTFSATPVQVKFPAGVSIAYLPADTMPFDTGLAVDTNGNAWGWGDNRAGSLCLGNDNHLGTPQELPLANVTAIAGAGAHTLYDSNGTVYACGLSRSGALGNGVGAGQGGQEYMTPQPVDGIDGTKVKQLVASYSNSGALMNDGSYYDWGFNGAGQLGIGTTKDADVPMEVNLPAAVSQVALGGSLFDDGETYAVLADGSLWGWGNGQYGQLEGSKNQTSPTQLAMPPSVTSVAALACGGATCYVVSADGGLWSVGNGQKGQLGDGNNANSPAFERVASGISQISATAYSALAY